MGKIRSAGCGIEVWGEKNGLALEGLLRWSRSMRQDDSNRNILPFRVFQFSEEQQLALDIYSAVRRLFDGEGGEGDRRRDGWMPRGRALFTFKFIVPVARVWLPYPEQADLRSGSLSMPSYACTYWARP